MKYLSLVTLIFFLGLISCKKKFDLPSNLDEPIVTGYTTIARIKAMYHAYYFPVSAAPLPNTVYKFNTDSNIVCTVIADESSGNIYKSVYVNDKTGAIKLNLLTTGGLNVGDKIRINLNGIKLNNYGGVIQLDSINLEKKIVKLESGHTVTPIKVNMNQLINDLSTLQSQLIILDSIEFDNGSKSQPYADAVNKNSVERTIINSYAKNLVVRTSGYASFANALTPCGKGSIAAVLGEYNGTIQLTIRKYSDVAIASGNCPLLVKHFNDNSLSSGGWTTYNVMGNVSWIASSYRDRQYAFISNYSKGVNTACESWLISPSINLSNLNNPILSFETAYKYTGDALKIYVSNDYNSGHPSNANWTELNPTLSLGNFAWVNSGDISLANFKSDNFHVAFKYTGTNVDGSSWEVDNVSIIDGN
jgi:hypothetical protein